MSISEKLIFKLAMLTNVVHAHTKTSCWWSIYVVHMHTKYTGITVNRIELDVYEVTEI